MSVGRRSAAVLAVAGKAVGLVAVSDPIKSSTPEALERLASQPTVNIEGLVAGYTGPGGKTILPGRAVAKLDLRLVPDQTREEAVRKLRAHLDARGFEDTSDTGEILAPTGRETTR